MLQRSDIENRDAGAIATDLKAAFNRFCAKSGAATPEKTR
jgi:hypothetical protein